MSNEQNKPTDGSFNPKQKSDDSIWFVILGLTIFILIMILFSWGIYKGGSYLMTLIQKDSEYRTIILATTIIGSGVIMGFFVFKYLERGLVKDKENLQGLLHKLNDFFNDNEKRLSKYELTTSINLDKRLQEISSNFNKSINVDFNIEQREEILNKLNSAITNNVNEEFLEKINLSIKEELKLTGRERYNDVLGNFQEIKNRLSKEISDIRSTAFRNLAIGSGITLIALIVLVYFVLNENFNSPDKIQVLLHFLPRLSLAVFMELFAFFFLRLYRTNLDEIKYYHNEFTNAEMKFTSLVAATNFGSASDVSNVVMELVRTERNFILKKGDSTVDIEKSKLDKDSLKEVLSIIAGTLTKSK